MDDFLIIFNSIRQLNKNIPSSNMQIYFINNINYSIVKYFPITKVELVVQIYLLRK